MYLEFDYAFWFEIHSGRRHYYARPCFCRTETAAAAENNFMAKAASASEQLAKSAAAEQSEHIDSKQPEQTAAAQPAQVTGNSPPASKL